MEFKELLPHLRFGYHANMTAMCQRDPPVGLLLDSEKVKNFPSFYDWMVQHCGISRFKLSAHGIGRDIKA